MFTEVSKDLFIKAIGPQDIVVNSVFRERAWVRTDFKTRSGKVIGKIEGKEPNYFLITQIIQSTTQ